ncbi:MAG TPA: hypothetical protein VK582_06465 [Pyrinomonadaceae bacterium]|nr:hypothetical protein [Pyrinomonadaceae bacterium]
MTQTNAKPQDVHSTILIERLSEGWTPEHSGWPQELMRRFACQLNATTELVETTEANQFQFMLNMNDLCLRGMNNVRCLILGAEQSTASVRKFWQNAATPGSLPFIFALSDDALKTVRENFPRDRCLTLDREEIKKLLGSAEPQRSVKQLLWQQIPRRRLDPYNLLTPAEGVMFFGRQNELARLIDEDTTSFAIAGPSRIGKTSLLKRYHQEMVRRRDPNSRHRFLISFTDCRDTSSDNVARYLAMKIAPSFKSDKITTDGLQRFLTYHAKDGPLDLLLDEVEFVCESDAFKALGAATRDGHCRLILCGKEVLLKMALNAQSVLGCRLTLTQLEPLDENAATDLILKPFEDLGFSVAEPNQLVENVLRLTGRLPYLLQFCGQKLAELAIEQNVGTISMEHVELLRWDFVTAQYFVRPLIDLADPETRLLGLSLLKNCAKEFSVSAVQELAHSIGISVTPDRALDVCNSLVINNVLTWRGGSYRIANDGLHFFASQGGYLDHALKESEKLVKARLKQ